MFNQFEEKGKIFSNVITKKPIKVHIQTTTHMISGKVHIRPDDRLKDELNQTESFLAVTDAIIYEHTDKSQYFCSFLAVNRSQIVWILQDSEMKKMDMPEEK
jgi:hypothetical protein